MDGSWRPGLVAFVGLSLLLFLTDQTSAILYGPVECDAMELEKVGCFADNQQVPRPLPEILFTDLNETSPYFTGVKMNEPDPDNYMNNLICRCAQEALDRGYNMFGLQHYGECWSGRNTLTFPNFNRDGPATHCITWKGQPCTVGVDCIGEDNTNFVYKAKDKPQTTTKPTPSTSGTSTPKSTGSPTKPSSRQPTTKKTTKPTKTVPSPTPSGSATSTAKSTGRPTQPSSRPSTISPIGSFSYPFPPCTSANCQQVRGQCIPPACYPASNTPYVPIPQQIPSYQVPQSIPYSTCPQLPCPATCYPACSFTCCRSKLPKKSKAKSHQKRAALDDLIEP